MPFEGLVEVGGAVGTSFEAQAINVSSAGMSLRTAYLPEAGQPLTCRFDTEGGTVLASGEVAWRKDMGRGGEFGVHFTDIDDESATALATLVGDPPGTGGATSAKADGAEADDAPGAAPLAPPCGAKVRLHIEGLGSPMRARVREARGNGLIVGSELGFLRVGKSLELEDAGTGGRRSAEVDRVDVEMDGETKIPQLIVGLRFEGGAAEERISGGDAAPRTAAAGPSKVLPAEDVEVEEFRRASGGFKSTLARGAARVGPAMTAFAKRAGTTLSLLASRSRSKAETDGVPARRTTAPAPGGGLHTSGRRVVRGESTRDTESEFALPKTGLDRRKLAVGGAIGVAVILAAVAMRKPSTPPVTAETAPAASNVAAAAAPGATDPTASPGTAPLAAGPGAPGAPVGVGPLAPAPMSPMVMPPATISPAAPMASSVDDPENESREGGRKAKKLHVAPFSNGTVAHGNVLRLKMDGPIERIQGASQPTGFTVVLPNRKSLEAAGPLAARDGRIASIRVSNDPRGAELAVAFKDGVPNYIVRAKGDTLEMVLAPAGTLADAEAKARTKAQGATKHGRHASKHGAPGHAAGHHTKR